MTDKKIMKDINNTIVYVCGQINDGSFDNIYQTNGIRYFRAGTANVAAVAWNNETATGYTIKIFYIKIS